MAREVNYELSNKIAIVSKLMTLPITDNDIKSDKNVHLWTPEYSGEGKVKKVVACWWVPYANLDNIGNYKNINVQHGYVDSDGVRQDDKVLFSYTFGGPDAGDTISVEAFAIIQISKR